MSKEEITRQQLEAVRDHLMIQFGSVLFLSLAFLVFVGMVFFVALNLRRWALGCGLVIAVLTFMVPTPITFYLSPVVALTCGAGIIWITLRARATKRAAVPTVASVAQRRPTSAVV